MEHELGESPATAPRRPLELVYCEYHCSKQDALRLMLKNALVDLNPPHSDVV